MIYYIYILNKDKFLKLIPSTYKILSSSYIYVICYNMNNIYMFNSKFLKIYKYK